MEESLGEWLGKEAKINGEVGTEAEFDEGKGIRQEKQEGKGKVDAEENNDTIVAEKKTVLNAQFAFAAGVSLLSPEDSTS